jgi:hypothetical protein
VIQAILSQARCSQVSQASKVIQILHLSSAVHLPSLYFPPQAPFSQNSSRNFFFHRLKFNDDATEASSEEKTFPDQNWPINS